MIDSFWIVREEHIFHYLIERVLSKLSVYQVGLILELGGALKIEAKDLILEKLNDLSVLLDIPLFLKLFLSMRDQICHGKEGHHVFKVDERCTLHVNEITEEGHEIAQHMQPTLVFGSDMKSVSVLSYGPQEHKDRKHKWDEEVESDVGGHDTLVICVQL